MQASFSCRERWMQLVLHGSGRWVLQKAEFWTLLKNTKKRPRPSRAGRRRRLGLAAAAPPSRSFLPRRRQSGLPGPRREGGSVAFPLLPSGSRRTRCLGPPEEARRRGSPPGAAMAVATGSGVIPAGSRGSRWGREVMDAIQQECNVTSRSTLS
jgi:hypothetical protein